MTSRPSRPPSAATLVLASFTLTVAALVGPHWLREHGAARPAALVTAAAH